MILLSLSPRRTPNVPLSRAYPIRPILRLISLTLACATFVACTDDLDEPWELTHSRVLAVRATPPAIQPGQQSTLDALLLHTDSRTQLASPDAAQVLSPPSLSDLLARTGDTWTITAPDATRLAAARAELSLPADAPVPLILQTSFGALSATKTILLGAASSNPSLSDLTVGGAFTDPQPTTLTLPRDTDVPLSVSASTTDSITWLTSTGTLTDFDLPRATLKIEADDPAAGELVVVFRDASGGVTWKTWPISVE